MKFLHFSLFRGNNSSKQALSKVTIHVFLTLLIFILTTLSCSLCSYYSLLKNNEYKQPSFEIDHDLKEPEIIMSPTNVKKNKKCDIFSGEWVPNPEAPYYTNTTCWEIHEHQNCMKYGRPDSEFMKWRWKPNECELPIFNPFQFLEIMRGKSMAFVGDSIGRNHMQSMICLLSRVEFPADVSYTDEYAFKRWTYPSYNFTMATFWSPYLVKTKEVDSNGGLFNLYLDEFDERWTTQIEEFDYVIINAGQWFLRPIVFYEKQKIVGCQYCSFENVTYLSWHYGYKRAFRTAYKALISARNFMGVTLLRTYAPSHFENGVWDKGGNCVRTKPFKRNETSLDGYNLELYKMQVGEFKTAEKEAKRRGLKFMLLDTTQAMLLRPDGHPDKYGHPPNKNLTLPNDCVHWCLPGPIDTWSDFLLEMLKIEDVKSTGNESFPL
ncbi:protein trichome birefringence-like 19 [Cajanus cajan]|nr:protein trichome birefringence-like 19 [Cajanus cajan]